MEIKKIKMSPKKGGNGFVSSYSVNIGSNEAKECGLIATNISKTIVKVIDPENRQIIIKEKEFTLTEEVIQTVIAYATKSNSLSKQLTHSLPHTEVYDGYMAVDICDIPIPGLDTDNPYAKELFALDTEFYQYLCSLPYEMLTDLMTLMYIGRNQDADMTLLPIQRFGDYWAYLETNGCFRAGPESIADQIMDKSPLVKYLQNGLRLLREHAQSAPVIEDVEGENDEIADSMKQYKRL